LLKTEVLDVAKVREDFPILRRMVHGKRLVYLDNAATTQKPQEVIEALDQFYTMRNANAHRSVHTLGEEATAAFEGARKAIAKFVGVPSAQELIFLKGTTEATNLVRFAWGEKFVKKGDTLVSTLMEHHSNIVPWQLLAKKTGAKMRYVGLNADGTLDMGDLENALKESPSLVAVTQCSNVLGTINDVAAICKKSKAAGAVTLVDAAQSVPHMPVDASNIGCDFLAFSGHKMLGPTGIGALYGRRSLLEEMEPFHGGGDMIKEVHLTGSTWNELPYKFEAGTSNIADAIGLGAAVAYLARLGMDNVRKHELELMKYALEVVSGVKGVTVYGPPNAEERGGVLSFNLEGVHPHDLATILDEEGIAIRSGHHCAQPLMEWLDVPATSRASFYVYNSYDDVDALKAGLEKAKGVFGV
jgi:cysteine desulfurase/selenocysteine lyase